MLDLDLNSFLTLDCCNFSKIVSFLVLLDRYSVLVLMTQLLNDHLVKIKRFVFPEILEHFLKFLLFDGGVLFGRVSVMFLMLCVQLGQFLCEVTY